MSNKHTNQPNLTSHHMLSNSQEYRFKLIEELDYSSDPSEFDVPSKWPRRYLAYRTTRTLQDKTLAESTASEYETRLREWVNFTHERDCTVLNVEFSDFLDFLIYCIELGRRTSTIMNRVSTIKNFHEHLVIAEEDVNPAISPLQIGTIQREEVDKWTPNNLERTALSKENVEKLFGEMNSKRDKLMTIVAVETGFRNSDIRGIRVSDIDTCEEPEITAHDPKYGEPYTVPISQELALELDIWITQGRQTYQMGQESDYLFLTKNGNKIQSSSTFGEIIVEAADEAGIQGTLGTTNYEPEYMKCDTVNRTWNEVVPHTLRHTFITLLEKEGVPIEYRQLLANHSSPEVTERYSHGKQEILKQVTDCINLNY